MDTGDIGAGGEVLQVAIETKRETVPRPAHGFRKDHVQRSTDPIQIIVLHISLLKQLLVLAGQGDEHLHMKISCRRRHGGLERFRRRAGEEGLFTPRNQLPQA